MSSISLVKKSSVSRTSSKVLNVFESGQWFNWNNLAASNENCEEVPPDIQDVLALVLSHKSMPRPELFRPKSAPSCLSLLDISGHLEQTDLSLSSSYYWMRMQGLIGLLQLVEIRENEAIAKTSVIKRPRNIVKQFIYCRTHHITLGLWVVVNRGLAIKLWLAVICELFIFGYSNACENLTTIFLPRWD